MTAPGRQHWGADSVWSRAFGGLLRSYGATEPPMVGGDIGQWHRRRQAAHRNATAIASMVQLRDAGGVGATTWTPRRIHAEAVTMLRRRWHSSEFLRATMSNCDVYEGS